jgi:hypothetical protein
MPIYLKDWPDIGRIDLCIEKWNGRIAKCLESRAPVGRPDLVGYLGLDKVFSPTKAG